MHPVTEAVYELKTNQRVRHKGGHAELGRLSYQEVAPSGLSYRVELDDHPQVSAMRGQVLPGLGLQVVQFEYLEPKPLHADFNYYVDIVRVTEQGERWVVRDLYLDVLVYEGSGAKILDTDEYLSALQEGHLEADEADYTLKTAHVLLNVLAKHGHSLESYLQTEGVTLTWPRSKSTP
jgi:predicted RNA-binding protein associated with RNAse of E/G family